MRRGDPLTPQVRQAVCKWIVSAYRRRNDDSERVSFPVPTKAKIATADCIRLAIAILFNCFEYYYSYPP